MLGWIWIHRRTPTPLILDQGWIQRAMGPFILQDLVWLGVLQRWWNSPERRLLDFSLQPSPDTDPSTDSPQPTSSSNTEPNSYPAPKGLSLTIWRDLFSCCYGAPCPFSHSMPGTLLPGCEVYYFIFVLQRWAWVSSVNGDGIWCFSVVNRRIPASIQQHVLNSDQLKLQTSLANSFQTELGMKLHFNRVRK